MKKKRLKITQNELPSVSLEPSLSMHEDINGIVVAPKKKSRFLAISFLFLLLCIALVGYLSWRYLESFNNSAGLDTGYLFKTMQAGLKTNPFEERDSNNLLFLGIDRVGLNRSNSLLTDTIIIVNLNKDGVITLVPIPRDLWIDALKTKVNALYYYGEKSQEVSGEQLVRTTIKDITDLTIDHVVLLDLNSVEKIVDAVGGINLNVEESFTDNEYPRDDVPLDAMPISSRYKTISFEKGMQHLTGSRSLEYIRSRKSQNENENTDEARSSRQEKVINALVSRLSQKEFLKDPKMLGNLYKLWHTEIKTSLSDEQVVSYAGSMVQKNLKLQTLAIPIKTGESDGILYNPPIKKHNQWVYEPVDSSWQEVKDFMKESLSQ